MSIKNKKDALRILLYTMRIIERMTIGNFMHYRNSIRNSLERLREYLSN